MKRNIKIIIGALLLSMFSIPSFAAAQPVKSLEYSNTGKEIKPIATDYKGLGISAGAVSGAGFSYSQFFAGTYGFKASAVVYLDDNQSFFDLGLQGYEGIK